MESLPLSILKKTECMKDFIKECIAMERILFPIVLGGGFIVLLGFLIWLFLHLEKKRANALQAIAAEIGLQFSATHHEDLSASMQ